MKILPFAPSKVQAIELDGPHRGYFTSQWDLWLNDLVNKANQNESPALLAFAGTYAGGGSPYVLNNNIVLPQLSSFALYANILQTFSGTAPTWRLVLKVDGAVVVDTGAVPTWQQTAHLCYEATLTAGAHTFEADWTGGTSAATLQRLDLVALVSAV